MIQQITALSNIDKAVIPRKVSFEGFLLDLESFARFARFARFADCAGTTGQFDCVQAVRSL